MFGLKLFPLLLAALAGSVMAVQGAVNALMGKIAGVCLATFIVHAVGTAFAGLLLPFARGGFSRVGQAPWYAWTGGVFGVLIIYSVARCIPKVGVAPATTAIILGQVLTATIIDHFGLFGMTRLPFSCWRILGVAFLAAGAWCLLKK
ncbi:transporter family-2 protein [Thermodesulfitimonas autotrophica]|uniref:Transporter family-2 protein n=1 Tax=Thermodesulfitimonas autotrophica TaxID=1894989 RepID=A0A3N5B9W3_9THEO|nr:DMT family transporter [Thermodesulfitimonas autotrophica]RPF42455.1 transporter family-2 protein [Thermodesulfitimonas autotrophica]